MVSTWTGAVKNNGSDDDTFCSMAVPGAAKINAADFVGARAPEIFACDTVNVSGNIDSNEVTGQQINLEALFSGALRQPDGEANRICLGERLDPRPSEADKRRRQAFRLCRVTSDYLNSRAT